MLQRFVLALLAMGACVCCAAASTLTEALSPSLRGRVEHVIVVMLENRAFDNVFGYRHGVNGINGSEFNPFDVNNGTTAKVFHTPTCPYVNDCDPNHGLPATTFKIFGPEAYLNNNFTDPTMSGFVQFEWQDNGGLLLDYCNVMTGFEPERLPILNSLADEFVLFDRFFASMPGPTWPNRLFFMAGTSSGLTETGPWYHDVPGLLFPTRTVFDQVAEAGGSWKVYYNDTPWELWVETLAHHPDNLHPVERLWEDAAKGTLPNFAFINPRSGINMSDSLPFPIGSNDEHPDHDVAVGESFLKDIYEAIRSSPQWNETLLVITYDEHGGFYDHVPTPLHVPPPGDNESSYPDPGFGFDRLGIRVPLLLVSPWLPKGRVVSHAPDAQKPFPNSEYELTSIIASARKLVSLLNATPALTKRDAWAATFEHLFAELDAPRTDCPIHLPEPPPFARPPLEEARLPLNSLQQHILTVHAHLAQQPFPHHVQHQGNVSQYLQDRYVDHSSLVRRWQQSKWGSRVLSSNATLQLVVQPAPLPYLTNAWLVMRSANVSHELIVTSPIWLSLFCLDAGFPIAAMNNVSISLCLGDDPLHNHDRSQHWVLRDDASIRPFHNQTLCLTTAMFAGNPTPFLDICGPPHSPRVDQNFGYHGYAAGEGDGGMMFYGDCTNNLAIVNATNPL